MQVHQLRYFVSAAEASGISRAAEKLRISQPALSRQIALLEDELGVQLFKRERQRVRLTEAGACFLPRARKILDDMDAAARLVRERFGGERRTLRLGFIGAVLDDVVAPAVRDFAATHPRVQVRLHDLSPQDQMERLRAGELDLGILGNFEERDRRRFQTRVLLLNRMAAVLPTAHPSAKRKSLALAALAKEKWVSLSDDAYPGRRAFLDQCCRGAGFRPSSVRDYESIPLMFAAIANGEGVGIAPLHAAKIPHAGCAFVPIVGPEITTQLLLFLPKKSADAPMEALAACLARHAERIARP
jgi:DNA-binding transcriptional LysR family regulator